MLEKEKKGVDNKARLDFLKLINSNIQEQIKLADTKASWVFSVLGLLTAVLTNILTKFKFSELIQTKVLIFGIIAIASLVLAFKHIILVMYPRITKGAKGGVMYFKDITQSTKEEYVNTINNLDEEGMIKPLQSQAYELAKIAEKKFSSLKIAIISCIFALAWIATTAIMLT